MKFDDTKDLLFICYFTVDPAVQYLRFEWQFLDLAL